MKILSLTLIVLMIPKAAKAAGLRNGTGKKSATLFKVSKTVDAMSKAASTPGGVDLSGPSV